MFCVFFRFNLTRTLNVADERRLLSFQLRCHRKINNTCWKDKVTNTEEMNNVTSWTTTMLKKLQLFAHIISSDA